MRRKKTIGDTNGTRGLRNNPPAPALGHVPRRRRVILVLRPLANVSSEWPSGGVFQDNAKEVGRQYDPFQVYDVFMLPSELSLDAYFLRQEGEKHLRDWPLDELHGAQAV